ncbi:MAG TPA: Rieske 2Fe-2S domain-containing protein [Chloroflexota bacterium]|nr:Rieske 2Fe-2S domain-containing protein [Chloroflexota bacterium]
MTANQLFAYFEAMLTQQQNDLITQTNPGTPCGELLRHYWQPVALTEELADGRGPLPVRIMGEDLVLFRDDAGQLGLVQLHCAHRGADLSYGRLEDGGLRCLYHGWLYDRRGQCLDQPGEPEGSTFHEKVKLQAYPCHERAGVILAYLGPGGPPPLPNLAFLRVPEDNTYATKLFHDCNYLQGLEGNLESIHLSFLHYTNREFQPPAIPPSEKLNSRGAAPQIDWMEAVVTDTGVRNCKLRPIEGDRMYTMTVEFILPNLCATPLQLFGSDSYLVNWHVPIDDVSHWKWIVYAEPNNAIDREKLRRERLGYLQPDYHAHHNRENRYLQDRASMESVSWSGMGYAFPAQDLCVVEGAGPIQDRTQEHLGVIDQPIAMTRRAILNAIATLEDGGDLPRSWHNGNGSRSPNPVAIAAELGREVDWKEYCKQFE